MMAPELSTTKPANTNLALAVNYRVKESQKSRNKRIRRKTSTSTPRVFLQPIRLEQAEDPNIPLYDQIVNAQRNSLEYQNIRIRWHRLQSAEEEIRQNWQRTIRNHYTVENDLIW